MSVVGMSVSALFSHPFDHPETVAGCRMCEWRERSKIKIVPRRTASSYTAPPFGKRRSP
jgi:hypothetical protein